MSRINAFSMLVVLVAALVFSTPVEAAKSRSRNRSLNGTFSGVITRLNRSQMSFEVGADKPKTYTVNYDANTAVSGGGKQGTLDDLAIGQSVKVTVKSNRATKIEVQISKGN